MTPYIVTVKDTYAPSHPDDVDPPAERERSRRAVATLDEAREYADDICRGIPHQPGEIGDWLLAMDSFPESGGTVGPLPDGTVIEVENAEAART